MTVGQQKGAYVHVMQTIGKEEVRSGKGPIARAPVFPPTRENVAEAFLVGIVRGL
jgi:hypothetical protein